MSWFKNQLDFKRSVSNSDSQNDFLGNKLPNQFNYTVYICSYLSRVYEMDQDCCQFLWFNYMSYEIWLRVFLTWFQIYCFKPNEIFLKHNGSYYFLLDLNKTTFQCGTIIPYIFCLYSKNLPMRSMIAITSFSRSCQRKEISVSVPSRLFNTLLGN